MQVLGALRKGGRHKKLAGDALTPKELARKKFLAEKAAKRRQRMKKCLDIRNLDIFGYEPNYTFPGYRSSFGAWMSVLLIVAVLVRIATRGMDFIFPEIRISENRLMFERDMSTAFELPRTGVIFKQTGWKPFYDPTYFRFRFQQGYSGRASNSSYDDLGDQPCSFVDTHGRIIEDEARCPALKGRVLGNFFDDRFRFVHVSMLRCSNGTDINGQAQPGPCRRPDEIDAMIWGGTVSISFAQTDMNIHTSDELQQLVTVKKQFTADVHATYDMFFTVRAVSTQPRAFFDSLDEEKAYREFVILDRQEASFTDFRPQKLGKWNQPDPSYVPQYAAFFLMLSDERIDQQRSSLSVFELMESWGASICFFFFLFSIITARWNLVHFRQQVKGLDLRDLSRDQFDHFGRLVDKSFQVPREMQDMHVVANAR